MTQANRASAVDVAELSAFFARETLAKHVPQVSQMCLPGNEPPWQSSRLTIRQGESYSVFSQGVIHWSSRHSNLHGDARFHLWARVYPGGRAVNLTANTGTFVADVTGSLELGIYMGMWADEFGTLKSPLELYAPLTGQLDIVVIVHCGDALENFESIARGAAVPDAIDGELRRLARRHGPPAGWKYLQEAGHAELFREEKTERGLVVHAEADDDQGIIRRPVDLPLTPSIRLDWRWRMEQHPSRAPENRAISHDYISVAAEFDNGRDLTWIWSSALASGTFFQCPIKVWQERETHYVVRSAADPLGVWHRESRRVYADVVESMGPPPSRITAVWIIALSTFQHGIARASFADIRLVDEGTATQVL